MLDALQTSLPLPPELIVVLVLFVFTMLVPLVVSGFIYRDAMRRNSSHALAWGIGSYGTAVLGSFFGGVVFWLFYFVVRDEIGQGDDPANANL